MLEHAHPPIAYSPGEAAGVVGCSRQYIHELINDGKLRRFKVGRLTKIPAADIHALVGYDPSAGRVDLGNELINTSRADMVAILDVIDDLPTPTKSTLELAARLRAALDTENIHQNA